ncbi:hypothetical protein HGO37_07870 [Rhizobium sp. CG4]|uniref:DUF6950 family protein n=1 Tax=Rhizobium sp. CG4 TaxID=2726075 RepID=UPI002034A596|nr:hypothetical protein [Rhizobium sp. CG4]MCM2455297.1 hypothetical protein [Rhizobium sp. CG4]
MENTLADFFRAYERKPWQPGQVDCCLFVASWLIWLGHPDPAQDWRGSYDSDEGFRAIIGKAGGLVPLFEQCAVKIRAKRVQCPSVGDVGVIGSQANIDRQFGAIFDGERWRVRFINSISPMMATPLAIWSI